jgi:hypothetical protein
MDAQKIRAIWNFILHDKLGQIRKVELFYEISAQKSHATWKKKKFKIVFQASKKIKMVCKKTWENVSKVPRKLLTRMALQFLVIMRE